jgi:hypothetical protein
MHFVIHISEPKTRVCGSKTRVSRAKGRVSGLEKRVFNATRALPEQKGAFLA